MNPFLSVTGTVTAVSPMPVTPYDTSGCTVMLSLTTNQGDVNMVVPPNAFVLDQHQAKPGDTITAFYDSMAPVPMIYPPQYRAVAIADTASGQQTALDYFNADLVNSSGTLKLNIDSTTKIMLLNGQQFFGNLADKILLVVYTASTRSIPAITTPSQIVVFCFQNPQ